MTVSKGAAIQIQAEPSTDTKAGTLWNRACAALKSELGDDTYGSWLSQAALRESSSGHFVIVTPTGIARDWIRRNAWRRICELWAMSDPEGRRLDLKSRAEFEADVGLAGAARQAASASLDLANQDLIEFIEPVSSDMPTSSAPTSSST